MINIAVILMLVFGGSIATVAAADHAKPGDILFPVDRAIEDVRLKFSSDEKKTELKLRFALERIEELEDVVAETTPSSDDDDSASSTQELELSSDEERIEEAFSTALKFIADVKRGLNGSGNSEAAAMIDEVIGQLDSQLETLPESVKLKIKSEKDKYKFELKIEGEDGKQEIKIEIKANGEVEIESESEKKDHDDDDNKDHDDDEDDDDNNNDDNKDHDDDDEDDDNNNNRS